MAKRTPTIDKTTIDEIDAATGDLEVLSEALREHSDRLIGTNWERGNCDLNLFPALAADRCDRIIADIHKALSRIEGIAALRAEVSHE